MKLGLDLSSVEVKAASGYNVVPTGEYDVVVSKAELKETKSGGTMLILGYEVQSGDQAGKTIKHTMNIVNQSAEATRIGLETLKRVAIATGHKNPNKIADTDELINKNPFLVIVEETVNKQGYPENRIKAIVKTSVEADTSFEAPKTSAPTTKKPWATK